MQLQVDPRRDDIKVLKRKKLLGRLDIDGRIRIFNKMTNSEALFVARVNSCWFPSKRTLAIHEFDLAMLKRIITGLVELYELGHPDISTGTLFFSQRAMHYLEEYLYGKGYHELWRQIIENRDLHAIKTGQYKILL